MKQPEHIVVLTTANTEGEAQRLAGLLLEKRQAACVNIVPAVDSRFWWQGRIDTAGESLLIVKTRASRLPEIIELIKGAHSNTIPETIALPIVGGNQDYLDWIDREAGGV
jgi:periplasmic divalent cation tolerance protein